MRRVLARWVTMAGGAVLEAAMGLADLLERAPRPSAQDQALARAGIQASITLRRGHPCETCAGRRAVPVGKRSAVTCPTCLGTGLDVGWLAGRISMKGGLK